MFGDIGGGPAILPAERQSLQQPHGDEDDRGRHADGGVGWQEADHKGRQPHQQHGHQKGILAPPQVAQPAEEDGPERPHGKAGGKGHQGEYIAGGLIHPGEELDGDDRGQRAVKIKVVPFDHRPDRGGEDDEPVVTIDGVIRG